MALPWACSFLSPKVLWGFHRSTEGQGWARGLPRVTICLLRFPTRTPQKIGTLEGLPWSLPLKEKTRRQPPPQMNPPTRKQAPGWPRDGLWAVRTRKEAFLGLPRLHPTSGIGS